MWSRARASGSQVHVGGSEAFENRSCVLSWLDEIQSGIRACCHHLTRTHAGRVSKLVDELDCRQQRITRGMSSDTPNQHRSIDLQASVELREIELPPPFSCSAYDECAIGHAVGDALDQRCAAVVAKTGINDFDRRESGDG